MLSRVEHEKSFITSGPGLRREAKTKTMELLTLGTQSHNNLDAAKDT